MFVGRRDSLIKLHGQSIELGEVGHGVRNALSEIWPSSKIGVCAMLVLIDVYEGREHITTVTSDSPTLDTNVSALWNGFQTKLPPYMMPSLFKGICVQTALPETASQELNR